MAHCEFSLLSVEILDDADWVSNGVLTGIKSLNNSSLSLGVGHNHMVSEQRVLVDSSEFITSSHEVAHLEVLARGEVPSSLLIEAGQIDTSRHEHAV